MDWDQFGLFLISVVGLFLWNRTEANSDRRDMINLINGFHKDILNEMKDFHGRLCAIEERNRK